MSQVLLWSVYWFEERTKSSLSLISSRWSHNPLGWLPSCSRYYYSTPSLLLHCAGGHSSTYWIGHSVSVASASNCHVKKAQMFQEHPRTPPHKALAFIPAPCAAPCPKSEFRLSINQSACQLPFLSTFLLFLWCFSRGSFNQGFLSPPRFELCYRSTRGRTHNAAWTLFGPASFRGGIDPPSLYLFSSSKLFIQQNWVEDMRSRGVDRTGNVHREAKHAAWALDC